MDVERKSEELSSKDEKGALAACPRSVETERIAPGVTLTCRPLPAGMSDGLFCKGVECVLSWEDSGASPAGDLVCDLYKLFSTGSAGNFS